MENSKIPGVYYFESDKSTWLQVDPKTGMSAGMVKEELKKLEKSPEVNKDSIQELKGLADRMSRMYPSIPPYTTWNGRMECDVDSKYAKRLREKCGGIIMPSGRIEGYWTAPEDWTEMAAGRESPRPFSPKTHTRINN